MQSNEPEKYLSMFNKTLKLFSILLLPVLLIFCFVLVPWFFFYSINSLIDHKKLENGATQTIAAKVINWKVGDKYSRGSKLPRNPYTVRYEFLPKHLAGKEAGIVKSNYRAVPKKLWDETRVSKKINIYYLIGSPQNHQVVGRLSPSFGDIIASILLSIVIYILACFFYIRVGRILTVQGFKQVTGWTPLLELFNFGKKKNK